jgi:hypothetical protein
VPNDSCAYQGARITTLVLYRSLVSATTLPNELLDNLQDLI